MCGRFSNAQPVYQYTATVRRQLHNSDDDHGAAGGHENDAGSSSTLNQGKDASDGSKSSSTGTSDSFLIHTSLSEEDYYPTHNVSPSSRVPVVRLEKAVPLPLDGRVGESNTPSKNALTIDCMRWGLLPSYTTSIPHGVDALRTINARDDSIMSGQGMWTPLLKKGKRCIIFCQGFFEWQKKQDGTRVAHFVGMLNEGSGRVDIKGKHRALMPMAGLYERCFIDEKEVMSFTVITTESNKQLNFLHDRMPVILPDSDSMMTWLGCLPASAHQVCSLLKPYDQGDLDVYPVPKEVGKVGNNEKSFILPVSARKDGIAAAFGRVKKTEGDVNSETHAPLSEEIKSVTSVNKRSLEEEDESLARKLQAEEDEKFKRVKVAEDDTEKKKSNKEDAPPAKRPQGDLKQEEDEQQHGPQPSSKFSPEPFNPPVSPPRPQGGYSTHNSKSPSTRAPAVNTKLKEAAKGTKDIRNFFGGK